MEGRGSASLTDMFNSSKFTAPLNPKDGYTVAECEDPTERRMLEFIIPIPY